MEQLEKHWHSLPPPEPAYTHEYSVDSSSASRSLSNGIDFFIIRALILGSGGYSKSKLRFEMVKGISDDRVSVDFERILRDLIEIEIINENLEDIQDGSIVLVDGNLYGRFTHVMEQLQLGGWYHLPLMLLEAMQRLFRQCVERRIMLIGVSKFSKTRVLTSALLAEKGISLADPGYLDVELLYRWRTGYTGYTTPLLLGEYAIQKGMSDKYDSPDEYRRQYFRDIGPSRERWANQVIEEIPSSPAIAMFHIIPREHHQPMRIDIPAYCIGIRKKIGDVTPFEFMDPSATEPVVKQLCDDFGGRDVHNALLYVVDREVRLQGRTVDTVYRPVLGKELGVTLEYDRSSGRFLG